MKLRVLVFLLPMLVFLQGGSAVGQPIDKTYFYFVQFAHQENTESDFRSFLSFVNKLERKRDNWSDYRFLNHTFFKTHQRFLKRYETYVSFSEMTRSGSYNCLTATALYALLLDHFGYEYKVIETNYHIFLTVKTSEGPVLLETTDPVNGFITDDAKISARIAEYEKNLPNSDVANGTYYHYSFKLYEQVDLDQLCGLLLYNEAIEAFNQQQYALAVNHLDGAVKKYQSPRIQEFSKMMMYSVVQSNLDLTTKEQYIQRLQRIRKQRIPGISAYKAENKIN